MSKYEKFDALLIQQIKDGRATMGRLCEAEAGLLKASAPHRVKDRWGLLTPEFRVIDKRLQALRKSGAIRYVGRAWEVIEK